MINKLFSIGNWRAYSRPIALIFGSPTTAVVFAIFADKSERFGDEEGWFFATQKELQQTDAVSRRSYENAIKSMLDLGIIEVEKKGMPARLWFRFTNDAEQKVFESIRQLQTSLPDATNKFVRNDKQVCQMLPTIERYNNSDTYLEIEKKEGDSRNLGQTPLKAEKEKEKSCAKKEKENAQLPPEERAIREALEKCKAYLRDYHAAWRAIAESAGRKFTNNKAGKIKFMKELETFIRYYSNRPEIISDPTKHLSGKFAVWLRNGKYKASGKRQNGHAASEEVKLSRRARGFNETR